MYERVKGSEAERVPLLPSCAAGLTREADKSDKQGGIFTEAPMDHLSERQETLMIK